MEEKILEIIQKEFYREAEFDWEKSASEIDTYTHEHYMKFVEWIETDSYVYQTADKKYYVNLYLNEVGKKYYTLEELYQYWATNINK